MQFRTALNEHIMRILEVHGLRHLHEPLAAYDTPLWEIDDSMIDRLGLSPTDESKLRELVDNEKQSRRRSEESNRLATNARDASLAVHMKKWWPYFRNKHPQVSERRLKQLITENWKNFHTPADDIEHTVPPPKKQPPSILTRCPP